MKSRNAKKIARAVSIMVVLCMMTGSMPVSVSATGMEGEPVISVEAAEPADVIEESAADEPAGSPGEGSADAPAEEPPEEPADESDGEAEPGDAGPAPGSPDGEISGMVWLDSNSDGARGAREKGVAGYPVYLYRSGNAAPIDETETNKQGNYSFMDLEPGSYIVGVKPNELGVD